MEWRDQGALLSVRRHGETSAIIEVFTAEHGRHAGLVRGATSRRMTPVLQPGAQLDLTWRARLDEHLGTFAIEPLKSRAAAVMGDRLALAGLNAITALAGFCLPEREPHHRLYARTIALLDRLGPSEPWPHDYLLWELALLDDMGFGLDLSACAVTGASDNLMYVSPRTGCAVTQEAAGEFADRLLPLPAALSGQDGSSLAEIAQGMVTTGYFLEQKLAPQMGDRPLPKARQRLLDLLERHSDRI